MGSENAVLIQADYPPSEDPELLSLLEHLTELAGARWAVLEIRPAGSDSQRLFTFGTPDAETCRVDLDMGPRHVATLRLGTSQAPSGSFAEVASFALRKALLARLYHDQVSLLRSALDTTSSAVLLFGSTGDIVYANPPADRLLSRQTEDGLVVLSKDEEPQPLFTLLCSMAEEMIGLSQGRSAWQGTLAVSDGSILACEIMRVGESKQNQRSSALVILQTTKMLPDRCLSAFVASHRLSPREEEVLRHLINGLNTLEIAASLGISRHTVRDHLKSLYRKTETGSRGELLNLFSHATSAPPLEH